MSISSYDQLIIRIDEVLKSGTPFDKIQGVDLNVLLKEASEFLFSRTSTSFVGSAVPTTNPGTELTPRYYLTATPGTYDNFKDASNNSIIVNSSEAAILIYDGSFWKKVVFPGVDLMSYATKASLADAIVHTTGKNLVNPSDPDYILLKSFSAAGALSDSPAPWRASGYIPVKPSTYYTPSYKHNLVFYNANKQIISVQLNTRTNTYVLTTADTAYIRFAGASATLQLEEGMVATTYEAFKYLIDTKAGQFVYAKHIDQTVSDAIAADRAAAITAATTPLYNEINQLGTQLDIAGERNTPYTISMMNFGAGVGCPTNSTNPLPVTGSAGSTVLTAAASDISGWGAPATTFTVAVKHNDGTFKPYMVKTVTGTQINIDKALEKDAAEVMAWWESPLGQHLSRYGSKALGDYSFNTIKRYALRNQIIAMANMPIAKQLSGQGIKLFSTVDDSLMADMALIGGATVGGFTPDGQVVQLAQPSAASIKYSQIHPNHFLVQQGGAIGKGISWTVQLHSKTGYIEMYIGTDIQWSSATVALELDGVVVYSKSVYGAVQRLDIPFSNAQVGVLKVTTETTANAVIRIGDTIWWQKRSLTGNIFSSTDRVVFLGDSWTQFPAALKSGEVKPYRPAPYASVQHDGMCFWPARFTELFVAAGGNASNIINSGRGGQTSVWGKYWFDTLVKAYNPTYVIIEFFTNDNSSSANVAGHTASVYDFSPTNPWVSQMSNAGGVFGSCTQAQWAANIRTICDMAIAAGIKPVVVLPGWTDAAAQAQSHAAMNELLIQGVK